MSKRLVGIFGGSFDPPTLAHEKVGELFVKELHLDELIYVVTKQNPLKAHNTVGSSEHRYNMLKMMITGHDKLSVCNIEIEPDMELGDNGRYVICEEENPSYAWNTLKALQMCSPKDELIFLGGSDILTKFYQWHNAEKMIEEFKLGIAIRPPHTKASTISPLREEHRNRVTIIESDSMPDISSTDVRTFFENGDFERARQLMRPDLYEYVLNNGIYRIPQRGSLLA